MPGQGVNGLKKFCLLVLVAFLCFINSSVDLLPAGFLGSDFPSDFDDPNRQGGVIWFTSLPENRYSHPQTREPIAVYNGELGVTIRSFASHFPDEESLAPVYQELMNNTIGEELGFLSHIDLIPDYPYGNEVAGQWFGCMDADGKLLPGRWIEIYGCDVDLVNVEKLAGTLAHEYGHHFTYYHLNKAEEMGYDGWLDTKYAEIRQLSRYREINSDEYIWNPAEIAAEDYVQLFGSPLAKKSYVFKDIRDVAQNGKNTQIFNTSMYNYLPQDNMALPLAAEVEGLYEYWVQLANLQEPYKKKPPTRPFLVLAGIKRLTDETGSDRAVDRFQYIFQWTQSMDDNTPDLEYTLVYMKEDGEIRPVRTTTDSKGRDALMGYYRTSQFIYKGEVPDRASFWVHVKDKDGLVVRSNIVFVDFSDPYKSLGVLPE